VSNGARYRSQSVKATEAAGQVLAAELRAGDIVLLQGDLASGKTTFVRGLVGGLAGEADEVSSPTFVLVQSYGCDAWGIAAVHHVDLYRLGETLAALREIGLEEVLSDDSAVVAVEWPKDTLARWLPTNGRTWRVAFTTLDDDSRQIHVLPPGQNH
jgi:tRNA threonylcarbamoyladenosine biosynthesis protein TsaE